MAALLFAVPLQLLASVIGFLTRDSVAGTGSGLLAGTWTVIGVVTLDAPPGQSNPGLGVVLLAASATLLVPAAASTTKLVATGVLTLASARFAVTGVAELTASPGWKVAAGVTGLALAVLALYAALGFELEDARRRTVLPLLRNGTGAAALRGDAAAQTSGVVHEAGVREQL